MCVVQALYEGQKKHFLDEKKMGQKKNALRFIGITRRHCVAFPFCINPYSKLKKRKREFHPNIFFCVSPIKDESVPRQAAYSIFDRKGFSATQARTQPVPYPRYDSRGRAAMF